MFKLTSTAFLAMKEDQDGVISDIDDMDEAIPSGKYVSPSPKPPRIRFNDMYKFCQDKEIKLEDLTEEQKKQFFY
ncbi:hypothetical protein [Psychrobacillus sp. L3]|uniref:hypothetical protein n=1 Tax=Psychrobacillus sp. L3 TaxID=3236891 RepID=UPI0036F2F841